MTKRQVYCMKTPSKPPFSAKGITNRTNHTNFCFVIDFWIRVIGVIRVQLLFVLAGGITLISP